MVGTVAYTVPLLTVEEMDKGVIIDCPVRASCEVRAQQFSMRLSRVPKQPGGLEVDLMSRPRASQGESQMPQLARFRILARN